MLVFKGFGTPETCPPPNSTSVFTPNIGRFPQPERQALRVALALFSSTRQTRWTPSHVARKPGRLESACQPVALDQQSVPPQTLAARSRQGVSDTGVRIVARWKVNKNMDARSDQNRASALPPAFQYASFSKQQTWGNLTSQWSRAKGCAHGVMFTWIPCTLLPVRNSCHWPPKDSGRTGRRLSSMNWHPKRRAPVPTSSKTPVKAGSLSSICGLSVGFPSPMSNDPLSPVVSRWAKSDVVVRGHHKQVF